MNKFLAELLQLAKEMGVNPAKLAGTRTNITPLKKPSLTRVNVDPNRLKDYLNEGKLSQDAIQKEIEETVSLGLAGKLNDVEMSRAIANLRRGKDVINPPAAEIVELSSKQRVPEEGIGALKEKAGLSAAPGTPLGDLELRSKMLTEKAGGIEQALKEKPGEIKNILDDFMKGQTTKADLENEGLVRATVRNIMENDIKAGRLKNLKKGDLYDKDPIEYFRTNYGEDALEQIDSLVPDFKKLYTADEAEQLVRTKYKLEPKAKPSDELNPFTTEEKADGGRIGYKDGSKLTDTGKTLEESVIEDHKAYNEYRKSVGQNPIPLDNEFIRMWQRTRLSTGGYVDGDVGGLSYLIGK